jgi:hypothetical protein
MITALLTFMLSSSEAIEVKPEIIPFSDPEIVNPLRGYHRWYRNRSVPTMDHYNRFSWVQLERGPGQYDFSIIEEQMEEARKAGAKFAFRVDALNEYLTEVGVPDYVRQRVPGYFSDKINTGATNKRMWVPDWNNPYFIARFRALVQALGRRYNGDPRLSYYDMGMYGRWGEWHTWQLKLEGTPATKRKFIDIQLAAFDRTRILMNSGGGEVDAFVYCLKQSPLIGVRCDSLDMPGDWFSKQFTNYPKKLAVMKDRWKTAPFIVECETEDITKVERWHLASISDFSWGKPKDQRFVDIGKRTGYRYELNSVRFPSRWTQGTPVTLEARWSNVGVTPLYERFDVVYELWPEKGERKVWSAKSQLDLTKFLPTQAPQKKVDRLRPTVPPGRYRLTVAVLDPTGYRKPLALAIRGRNPQGRYPLGIVEVAAR